MAGVSCFKIEGRLKGPEYVALTTQVYRKAVDTAWEALLEATEADEARGMEGEFEANHGRGGAGALTEQERWDLEQVGCLIWFRFRRYRALNLHDLMLSLLDVLHNCNVQVDDV